MTSVVLFFGGRSVDEAAAESHEFIHEAEQQQPRQTVEMSVIIERTTNAGRFGLKFLHFELAFMKDLFDMRAVNERMSAMSLSQNNHAFISCNSRASSRAGFDVEAATSGGFSSNNSVTRSAVKGQYLAASFSSQVRVTPITNCSSTFKSAAAAIEYRDENLVGPGTTFLNSTSFVNLANTAFNTHSTGLSSGFDACSTTVDHSNAFAADRQNVVARGFESCVASTKGQSDSAAPALLRLSVMVCGGFAVNNTDDLPELFGSHGWANIDGEFGQVSLAA